MNRKIFVVFIVAPVVFFATMVLTQLIPNSWVETNISKSRDIIKSESPYHDAYHVPQTHWLAGSDGYTDDIFLQQQIANRSNGIFYGAMMPDYDRYWHGYTIFLRPLLVFFDLSHIRQILILCFIVLLTILVYLIGKYINLTVAILFGIALALVNPPVIMISLQYSNMFLLMLGLSIILMLLLSKKRSKQEVFIFFAAAGCLTSFFDLLTTPSITLGIPLLLYIAYRIKNNQLQGILKDVFFMATLWGTGYFVAWFAKWLIGSIVLQRNIFADATQKVLFWSSDSSTITSSDVTTLTVFTDWVKRLVIYWTILIAAIIGLGVAFIARFFAKDGFRKLHLPTVFVLIGVTLIPIAWIIVARQHSFNHQWFSYRHLIILLFGISLIVWYIGAIKPKVPYKKTLQTLRARLAKTTSVLFSKLSVKE